MPHEGFSATASPYGYSCSLQTMLPKFDVLVSRLENAASTKTPASRRRIVHNGLKPYPEHYVQGARITLSIRHPRGGSHSMVPLQNERIRPRRHVVRDLLQSHGRGITAVSLM